ncbi:hypothetical protein AcW1_006176 [Taiwanofungus camphoratus]|nr:hypothetical protein AcV7_008570 [Antrodia cinnamomea]KAI0957950.1 hypothetical protein AcW1_006176 [Antrodia cinnamomea]
MPSNDAGLIQLTLSRLLRSPSWDLPEWNGPHSEDPSRLTDKLGDLDTSLALLQRYRNALRPIHRLAPDILILIFRDLVEEDSNSFRSKFGSCPWKYLAHVCYRWRAIALACPLLWTQISTRHPDAALTCLERSMDASLSLMIWENAVSEPSRVLGAVQSHVGRIRRLYLPSSLIESEIDKVLSPILQSPAQSLEMLYIYKVRSENDCFALPPIFDCQTPHLTTLKLCYAFPEMRSLTYANLKQLYIKGKKSKPALMDVSRLLEVLEACPHLQLLNVAKVNVVSSTEEKFRMLQLDNLRLLDITRCSPVVVENLVSRLLLPHCAIRIHVQLERAADSTFHFGIPKDLHETHHLHEIKRLHLEHRSASDRITIHGSTVSNLFQVIVKIPSDGIEEIATIAGPFLLSVVRTLDLSSLEEFAISELNCSCPHLHFTRKTWIEVFERMPLLKTLHIRRDCTDEGFCRAVLSALTTPNAVTGKFLCTDLETLTVVNDNTWSSLQCYLLAQHHANHGKPLRRVSMRLPFYENVEEIEDTDIPQLRQLIEVVDLDPPPIDNLGFPSVPPW